MLGRKNGVRLRKEQRHKEGGGGAGCKILCERTHRMWELRFEVTTVHSLELSLRIYPGPVFFSNSSTLSSTSQEPPFL